MDNSAYVRIRVRWLALVAALALVVTGALVVAAQDNGDGLGYDGRLNAVTHFGGDAFYCVDENMIPTSTYGAGPFAGIRVLNIAGIELWFLPVEAIEEATANLAAGESALVGSAPGTYGLITIFAYQVGNGELVFEINGFDEYGKPNQMVVQGCQPDGVVPHPAGNPSDLCTPSAVDIAYLNDNLEGNSDGFRDCYERACEGIPISSDAAEECFCAQYPNSIACNRIEV